jgi:hypothetical protein
MSFAEQLRAAKIDLTARQVAAAVSPLLSVRTVEDWLSDRRSPPAWTHEWILSRVRSPKKARLGRARTLRGETLKAKKDYENTTKLESR